MIRMLLKSGNKNPKRLMTCFARGDIPLIKPHSRASNNFLAFNIPIYMGGKSRKQAGILIAIQRLKNTKRKMIAIVPTTANRMNIVENWSFILCNIPRETSYPNGMVRCYDIVTAIDYAMLHASLRWDLKEKPMLYQKKGTTIYVSSGHTTWTEVINACHDSW